MDYFDIYITGKYSNMAQQTELTIPVLNLKKSLNNGFIGIEVEDFIAYTICENMEAMGVRCLIVPINYKKSTITIEQGQQKAFEELKRRMPFDNLTIDAIYPSTESVFTWRFGYSETTLEEGKVHFVLIDKHDGHVWTKKEMNTQIATEYYLELKTFLTKESIEKEFYNIALELGLYSNQQEGYLEADCLLIKIYKVNYGYKMQQKIGFNSDFRVEFCIPTYKKGYELGVQVMIPVLKKALALPISNAILFSNFDDQHFIFRKDGNSILINPDWDHWNEEEVALLSNISLV